MFCFFSYKIRSMMIPLATNLNVSSEFIIYCEHVSNCCMVKLSLREERCRCPGWTAGKWECGGCPVRLSVPETHTQKQNVVKPHMGSVGPHWTVYRVRMCWHHPCLVWFNWTLVCLFRKSCLFDLVWMRNRPEKQTLVHLNAPVWVWLKWTMVHF